MLVNVNIIAQMGLFASRNINRNGKFLSRGGSLGPRMKNRKVGARESYVLLIDRSNET
mgnify:CR=1 FL=1